jgi:hypothetical protein
VLYSGKPSSLPVVWGWQVGQGAGDFEGGGGSPCRDGDVRVHGHRGLTRLLDELGGERYAAALADHRRAVRAAFAAGREVDTQGDTFFYAFARASEAAAACSDAIPALDGGPIRVRIGLPYR